MKGKSVTSFEYRPIGGTIRAHIFDVDALFEGGSTCSHLDFIGYHKFEIVKQLRSQGIAVGRKATASLKGLPSVAW